MDTKAQPATQAVESTVVDPEAVELGRRIKTTREARGLSQEDLARAVGVRAGIVSRWENGKNVPRLKRLTQIAAALDHDVSYFTAQLDSPALDGDGSGLAAIERRLAALDEKVERLLRASEEEDV